MKIISYTFFVGILALYAFMAPAPDHAPATAQQEQGIYIFLMSKPASAYDYQGSIKKTIALSGKPAEMLSSMIKKCKKDYPQANGLIFSSIDMDKADCVKFKE